MTRVTVLPPGAKIPLPSSSFIVYHLLYALSRLFFRPRMYYFLVAGTALAEAHRRALRLRSIQDFWFWRLRQMALQKWYTIRQGLP